MQLKNVLIYEMYCSYYIMFLIMMLLCVYYVYTNSKQ